MLQLDPTAWQSIVQHPAMAIGLTVTAFFLAMRLQRLARGSVLLNPTLVAIVITAIGLQAFGVGYDTYMRGAGFMHFLLGPAVVVLAIPLYRQTPLILSSKRLLGASLAVGLPVGIVSAVGIAWALGATTETILTLAPKGATSGISIGVSEKIGGIPVLTAVLVICTGVSGAIVGPPIMRVLGVTDHRVFGVTMGISAHGQGIAESFKLSEVAGAFAGLGMALNGVLTAMVIPISLTLLR